MKWGRGNGRIEKLETMDDKCMFQELGGGRYSDLEVEHHDYDLWRFCVYIKHNSMRGYP